MYKDDDAPKKRGRRSIGAAASAASVGRRIRRSKATLESVLEARSGEERVAIINKLMMELSPEHRVMLRKQPA
eukprot:5075425-Pleurochrysis_carterae.AAC.1